MLNVQDESMEIRCKDIYKTDKIQQIAMWSNDSKVLSCANRSISIWDIKSDSFSYPLQSYNNYHMEQILSVDTDKSSVHVFASVAMDRRACLWDDRMETPAQRKFFLIPEMLLEGVAFSVV